MGRGSSSEACISLVSAGVREREEGEHMSKRRDMCHDRWKDGRTISQRFCIILTLPLVSQLASCEGDCERE